MTFFPGLAKKRFDEVTRRRYHALKARMIRKKLGPPPFSMQEFRLHCMMQMEPNLTFNCRYCKQWLDIENSAADHEIPLQRGGHTGLNNIRLICARDNDIKGQMLPWEYLTLLELVETVLPSARVDILKRLQMATKLAAGDRNRRKKAQS